ncbi:glycosyltransferase [Sphingobacterium lumbrici]|uniref:glycosyltransferase n=1 Tax=Sphingobacterium lumbrici TaxID=2559600 RepID=UPI00112A485D|nr:glycosyltransferase [Sphingobacterium lumbrici]
MKTAKSKTKNIVYVINQFYMHGGIQRMISHKIDAWIDNFGYKVTVITLNQGDNTIVYPPKNNFKLIDLGVEDANKHKLKDLFVFTSRLKKILNQEEPDLVITSLTGIPSLIVPLIKPQIKKALEIHSSGALSVTNSWKYKWIFLNCYHKVVLLNEDEKQYYKLSNLTVIPNFITSEPHKDMTYENRKPTILAAGRIHPDKQYDHLIKIWELVYKEHPDWSLEVYGDGDAKLLNQYQEYITQTQLERIVFKPATQKLEEVMKGASLFVLTSDTECFPMVLIECKKSILPVISYDSPNGPRHIISNDGILVEHNNIKNFASELSNLIKNEELRKQLANNAYVNQIKFSSVEVIKKWNELL